MSHPVQRSTIGFVVTLTLLGALAIAAHVARLGAQRRERSQREDLDDCRSMASQIERLRTGRQRALLKTKPSDELNRKIADWASRVGIPADRLIRIEPQQPSRIGDTPYLQQVTELEIMQTELPKLIELAQASQRDEEGLKVSSMRLSLPRLESDKDGPEQWNIELTLTYLIYSPTSNRP